MTTSAENDPPEDLAPEVQYVWSVRYVDALVRRDKNTDGTTDDLCDDETLYALSDANQNVTALVEADGDVAERYAYDPYGNVTIYDDDWSETRSESAYANTILFAGYWRDSETGLYHVRNRMYHVRLGLWLERDPAGYVDGMSLYEYVGGRPLWCQDPMGLFEIEGDLWEHARGAGRGIKGAVVGTKRSLEELAEQVADIGRLSLELGGFAVTGRTQHVDLKSNLGKRGGKPEWADAAEAAYGKTKGVFGETKALGVGAMAGAAEILKGLPGGQAGEVIADVGMTGKYTPKDTERLAATATEVGMIYAAEKLGQKCSKGGGEAAGTASDSLRGTASPKTADLPIAVQKQNGHISGTSQYANRIKQGKPTSAFFGEASGNAWTQRAWGEGTPTADPNIKIYGPGVSVGTGPNGGMQTQVRVVRDAQGRIHGTPWGPER